MITTLQVLHILLCVVLIGLILIQSGKGQGLAGAFGSFAGNAAQNLFGARTTDILTKVTGWLAAIYFISTITVAVLQINASTSVMSGMTQPNKQEVSATPTKEAEDAKKKLKEMTGKLLSKEKKTQPEATENKAAEVKAKTVETTEEK